MKTRHWLTLLAGVGVIEAMLIHGFVIMPLIDESESWKARRASVHADLKEEQKLVERLRGDLSQAEERLDWYRKTDKLLMPASPTVLPEYRDRSEN